MPPAQPPITNYFSEENGKETAKKQRTIAKRKHAEALFNMLSMEEKLEAARLFEQELLPAAKAARQQDEELAKSRAATLAAVASGSVEIIDLSAEYPSPQFLSPKFPLPRAERRTATLAQLAAGRLNTVDLTAD